MDAVQSLSGTRFGHVAFGEPDISPRTTFSDVGECGFSPRNVECGRNRALAVWRYVGYERSGFDHFLERSNRRPGIERRSVVSGYIPGMRLSLGFANSVRYPRRVSSQEGFPVDVKLGFVLSTSNDEINPFPKASSAAARIEPSKINRFVCHRVGGG